MANNTVNNFDNDIKNSIKTRIEFLLKHNTVSAEGTERVIEAGKKIVSDLQSSRKALEDFKKGGPNGTDPKIDEATFNTAWQSIKANTDRLLNADLISNTTGITDSIVGYNASIVINADPDPVEKKIDKHLNALKTARTQKIDDSEAKPEEKTAQKQAVEKTISAIKQEMNQTKELVALSGNPDKQTQFETFQRERYLIDIFTARKDVNSDLDVILNNARNVRMVDLFPPAQRANRDVYQAGDDFGKALHLTDDMRSGVGAGADVLTNLTKSAFNKVADGGKWLISPSTDKKYGQGANAVKSMIIAGGATYAAVFLLRNVGIEKLPLGTGSVIMLGAALTTAVLVYMGTQGHLQGKANFLAAEEAARNSLRNSNIITPGSREERLLNGNIAFNIQSHDGKELKTEITDPETGEKHEFTVENPQSYGAVAGSGAHLPANEIEVDNLPAVAHDGFGADYGILSRSQGMKTGAHFSLNA